jgi:hypothetical protein
MARNEVTAEIQGLAEQARAQVREVEELVGGLTDAQLSWRPAPDRWSIGEHLVHLPLATRPYLDSIDRAVADARSAGLLAPPPYRYGRIGEWFARTMEPPVRTRIRTMRRLVPVQPTSGAAVITGFSTIQQELVRSLDAADGVDLGRATMRSPYMRVLKLSLGSAYRVILAHNRRHLWHARRVLGDPGFPR